MAATGGSIESVSIRGRQLAVAADADVNMQLGGDNNETQMNGDGRTRRKIKTPVAWMLEGVAFSIDDDRGDLEFLQEIADETKDEVIVITQANGVSYQGVGTIDGEIKKSTQNTTAPVTLSGPGKLTQQ